MPTACNGDRPPPGGRTISRSESNRSGGGGVVTRALIRVLRERFRLDWDGAHGIHHWNRVRDNGRRIARSSGADLVVVEAFAFLHDVGREDEWGDPLHGSRSADFVATIREEHLPLTDDAFALLIEACTYHSEKRTPSDVTIGTCWDADRLDLGRIGIKPDPRFLCTPFARRSSTIEWAYTRSREQKGSRRRKRRQPGSA